MHNVRRFAKLLALAFALLLWTRIAPAVEDRSMILSERMQAIGRDHGSETIEAGLREMHAGIVAGNAWRHVDTLSQADWEFVLKAWLEVLSWENFAVKDLRNASQRDEFISTFEAGLDWFVSGDWEPIDEDVLQSAIDWVDIWTETAFTHIDRTVRDRRGVILSRYAHDLMLRSAAVRYASALGAFRLDNLPDLVARPWQDNRVLTRSLVTNNAILILSSTVLKNLHPSDVVALNNPFSRPPNPQRHEMARQIADLVSDIDPAEEVRRLLEPRLARSITADGFLVVTSNETFDRGLMRITAIEEYPDCTAKRSRDYEDNDEWFVYAWRERGSRSGDR